MWSEKKSGDSKEPNYSEELEYLGAAVSALLLEYAVQKNRVGAGLALPPVREMIIEFRHGGAGRDPVEIRLNTPNGCYGVSLGRARIVNNQRASMWTWAKLLSAKVNI